MVKRPVVTLGNMVHVLNPSDIRCEVEAVTSLEAQKTGSLPYMIKLQDNKEHCLKQIMDGV